MLLLIVAWFLHPLFRSKLTSFTFWSIIWPFGRIYFFLKLRLKQPPPQDYMAHHRGTYDKYSAGLSDKYNDKYSEGLAAKYNDKYAPRSSSSLMPASTDSMVGFMAKYKWVEIRNCKRNTDELKSKSIYYSLAKCMGHTCWNIDLSRKFLCSWVFLTYFKQGCWCNDNHVDDCKWICFRLFARRVSLWYQKFWLFCKKRLRGTSPQWVWYRQEQRALREWKDLLKWRRVFWIISTHSLSHSPLSPATCFTIELHSGDNKGVMLTLMIATKRKRGTKKRWNIYN